ncbi:MAG: BMP family ABC transporter substrate-binding protein, partial [Sphaerochaetaceae bacterium]|nr:BMP family ABC transporter substrate-binding protein [Sphaerochaetaceae bacterium]
MKKIISFFMVMAMICSMTSLFANGNQESAPAVNPKANQVAIILQAGGLGDQGYNDGAKVGFDMMVEKYGIDGVLVEAAAVAEADTFIRQLAEDGYGLIICLDWTIIKFVKEAAPDYPNTKFVVLGKSLPGAGTIANLIEPYTALHERAWLCGMVSLLCAK